MAVDLVKGLFITSAICLFIGIWLVLAEDDEEPPHEPIGLIFLFVGFFFPMLAIGVILNECVTKRN